MFEYVQYIWNSISWKMRGGLRSDGAGDAKMAPQRSKVKFEKSPCGTKMVKKTKKSVAFGFLRSIQGYIGIWENWVRVDLRRWQGEASQGFSRGGSVWDQMWGDSANSDLWFRAYSNTYNRSLTQPTGRCAVVSGAMAPGLPKWPLSGQKWKIKSHRMGSNQYRMQK